MNWTIIAQYSVLAAWALWLAYDFGKEEGRSREWKRWFDNVDLYKHRAAIIDNEYKECLARCKKHGTLRAWRERVKTFWAKVNRGSHG